MILVQGKVQWQSVVNLEKKLSGSLEGVHVTGTVSRKVRMSSTVLTEEALISCPRYDCYVCHYQD